MWRADEPRTALSPADEAALLYMSANPSNGALQQLINDHHEHHQKAHERLRTDVNAIGQKISGAQIVQDAFQKTQTDILLRLQRLELTPTPAPSIERMSWTTKQLVAIVGSIVGACLFVGGGILSVRSDISDVQRAITSAQTLQNQRNESLEKQLTDVKAELQLRRIEIQNVSNKLSDFMAQKK